MKHCQKQLFVQFKEDNFHTFLIKILINNFNFNVHFKREKHLKISNFGLKKNYNALNVLHFHQMLV